MRTIEQLMSVCKEAADKRMENEKEYRSVREEIEKGLRESGNAIRFALQNHDQKGYESAASQGDYFRAIEAQNAHLNEPVLTPEQSNQIIDELKEAYLTECFPLMEHLLQMVDEWNAIIGQVKEKYSNICSCNDLLKKARGEAYNSPKTKGYKELSGFGRITTSMDPFCRGQVKKAIELFLRDGYPADY
ncbi:MAG: hypothetical protein E7319_10165 [Clostridiales bacterium]|nr:hypothetical protein [Clostridiales bacterium]